MTTAEQDLAHLRQLRSLLARPRLRDQDLLALPRLYRHACSVVARLESTGESPRTASEARRLIAQAHALLHRERGVGLRGLIGRTFHLLLHETPRCIRAEWRLLALTAGLVYGLAAVSWLAVSADLDLAPSLLQADHVRAEIEQLEATAPGEPFRGNFTFGFGESPGTAGWIMMHNMMVGVLFFASALVPPLYLFLLSTNGLMLGTYTAVAGHWGQAGAISSILWCHGVIEIQTLLLAGTAGLVLVRAWVRPGPRTRRHAMQIESERALRLLLPVFPMLFVAGMIEGFVSPHAPLGVRIAVAVGSGILLVAWVLGGGRGPAASGADATG